VQISPGVWRGHPEKIHLVERGDEAGSVATECAMKIDWLVPFISQDGQYGFDMPLRRRDDGGIHPSRDKLNAVPFGFLPFRPMQKGNKLQIHNVLDVPRLKKLEVGIGFRPRSFVHAVVYQPKMNERGAGRCQRAA
jgi:hypothetical protein